MEIGGFLMSTVGSRLRRIREEKGLEQKEAAIPLGMSNVVLNRYENDKREPDLKTTSKMAQFYGVSTDWIIHGNKIPIPDDPKYFDLGEVTLEEEYARKGLTKEMIRHYLDAAALAVEEARKMHNKPIK
jgi:transcriptional regulator with XRE-family HTH domain